MGDHLGKGRHDRRRSLEALGSRQHQDGHGQVGCIILQEGFGSFLDLDLVEDSTCNVDNGLTLL